MSDDPAPLVWTSAIDATGTQTFCGGCGHPMHWHECGAGVNTAGPCRCRNDEAIPYRDTWANGRESRYQRTARTDPLTVPEPEPAPIRGCSVISWVILSWAIAAVLLIAVVVSCVATPRPQPETVPPGASVPVWVEKYADSVHMAQAGTGAPHSPGGTHSAGVRGQSADVWYPRPAGIPGGAPPLTGTPADFTSQGTIAWAAPRYGPRHLALPEPRGTVATICGPAGCITRTSTDYGPDQRTYPDRIADVSAADFPVICGVPLSFGRCPGSVTILSRPTLPETDR